MKKFMSLLLVFSILSLSMPLTAKEKKGVDLIVQKTDGTQARGELIAVKQNSLLLLERESGADVTINIDDIRVIIIVKKSKLLEGAGIGLLICGGAGAVFGYVVRDPDAWLMRDVPILVGAGVGALLGVLIGGLVGKNAGKDETFQFEGLPDSTIKANLIYLRKKARIKNAQ